MKIKSDEITSVIKQEIEQYSTELSISEVGKVVEVGDGIARVYGLSNVMAGELLEFQSEHGTVMGQAMNLESDTVGVVLYGDGSGIREGDTARSTGKLLGRHRGAGHRCSSARDPADAVRHQGRRLDDPSRPWPARARHR